MHGVALLLGLLAAGCLYTAAPNQALLAPASRAPASGLCAVALMQAAIAVVLWNDVLGWTGATIAVVLVVAGGLSLWPMAGAWVQHLRADAKAPS
ncbi:hypothetical protein [Ralstonia sp. UBA689]|uniref:hypothetical protein n=1 Tax=Ralstonia sp. UBA689 TaxID=1947373 RepID=UPI0025F1F837|nr:hypothetical protein [Ralstonia sp. UBA689]